MKPKCARYLGRVFRDDGSVIEHQCTDLFLAVPDSVLEWLITQVDDPSAPTNPDEPCTLGFYLRGDPVLTWHCSCLAEALQIAEGAKTL